jgi:hypothetical protein
MCFYVTDTQMCDGLRDDYDVNEAWNEADSELENVILATTEIKDKKHKPAGKVTIGVMVQIEQNFESGKEILLNNMQNGGGYISD